MKSCCCKHGFCRENKAGRGLPLRAWSTWCGGEAEKRRLGKGSVTACKYLAGGASEGRSRLLAGLASDGARGKQHKVAQGKFPLKRRRASTVRLLKGCSERQWRFCLWRCLKTGVDLSSLR